MATKKVRAVEKVLECPDCESELAFESVTQGIMRIGVLGNNIDFRPRRVCWRAMCNCVTENGQKITESHSMFHLLQMLGETRLAAASKGVPTPPIITQQVARGELGFEKTPPVEDVDENEIEVPDLGEDDDASSDPT